MASSIEYAWPDGESSNTPATRDAWALLIGAGYDLPCTVKDAKELKRILLDPTRCAFPESKVIVKTDSEANRTEILQSLTSLAELAEEESFVIIFFSGHGIKNPLTNDNYIMPNGYDIDQLSTTAISGTELGDKISAIKAKQVLLIFDCCFAGGFNQIGASQTKSPTKGLQSEPIPLPEDVIHRFTSGSGRFILTSSRKNEKSLTGKPVSIFTRALIEALCGCGEHQDNYVRVGDIITHCASRVAYLSRDRQHPTCDWNGRAENYPVAFFAGGENTPKSLPQWLGKALPDSDDDQTDGWGSNPSFDTPRIGNVSGSVMINYGSGNVIGSIGGDFVNGNKITKIRRG
ncbi:caspase domain-containing protein [Endogone sp. FLAS-F59071]|nr:caspase domain-containing protein [Endogone sp. FLAS-F59071]|eukprot:RUS21842.1 caspase domain-containing protein [Endogone sp. FLAS-F59071]